MILYGASGHCKVIIDCLKSQNEIITAIIDDDIKKDSFYGFKVLHSTERIEKNDRLIISIGDNRIRKNIAERLDCIFGTAINIKSIVGATVKIGEGTVIMHNAVIQADTVLGKHVIINTSASVDHDCLIEDYVHISPKVALCGAVEVGEGTHIGAGAVVIPGKKIGKWCIVGAGSVVIKDIPDYAVVVGNPGRIIKSFNPFADKNEK
ncbi:MAG: acetyltransferase [Bacteroidota bacterium]